MPRVDLDLSTVEDRCEVGRAYVVPSIQESGKGSTVVSSSPNAEKERRYLQLHFNRRSLEGDNILASFPSRF